MAIFLFQGLDQNYYIKSEPSSPPLQPSFRSTAAGGPAVVSSPAPALPNSGFRPITHPAVTIKKEPESYFQVSPPQKKITTGVKWPASGNKGGITHLIVTNVFCFRIF